MHSTNKREEHMDHWMISVASKHAGIFIGSSRARGGEAEGRARGRTFLGEVGHDADGVGDALQPGVSRGRRRLLLGHRHRHDLPSSSGAAVLLGLLLGGLHHADRVAAGLLTH
jgi:hypothetical protein